MAIEDKSNAQLAELAAGLLSKLVAVGGEILSRLEYVDFEDDEPDDEPDDEIDYAPPTETLEAETYQPGWGDVIFHKRGAGTEFVLSDKHVVCGARSGIIIEDQLPHTVQVDITNVHLTQGPVTVGWGICGNYISGAIEHVSAEGLGLQEQGNERRDGHAIYAKLGGDLYIGNYTAIRCAGQALQLVTRPHEGPVPHKLVVTLDDIWAADCSQQATGHGGGGSAMLALYCASTGGTHISAGKITLIGDLGQPGDPKEEPATRGGIQLWADGHDPRNAWFERFTCTHLNIQMEKGDRHPLDFKDTRHVKLPKVTGFVERAHNMVNGLPVLISMTRTYGEGSLFIGSTTFPFVVKIDGTYTAFRPQDEALDLSWSGPNADIIQS